MSVYDLTASYTAVPEAFTQESRKTLGGALRRIEHCFGQLPEPDVWWRPHPGMNAPGNLVLHLCGNLTQWVVDPLLDRPSQRDRDAEFADRGSVSTQELLRRLTVTVAEADRLIGELGPDELLESRRIQGFDTVVLAAVFHAVSHFEAHTQEIVYITRLRLGDRYRVLWTPDQAGGRSVL